MAGMGYALPIAFQSMLEFRRTLDFIVIPGVILRLHCCILFLAKGNPLFFEREIFPSNFHTRSQKSIPSGISDVLNNLL